MAPSKLNSSGEASISCSQPENGFPNSFSLFSEKEIDELLQPSVQGSDDHLIEFSEAMRTVAKALRRAAEGKASAQAEAAEWKRKYELERARNMLEFKGNAPFFFSLIRISPAFSTVISSYARIFLFG